jgi:uncharacterized protein YjdB
MQLARNARIKLQSILASSLAVFVMLSCGGDSTAPPPTVAVASVALTPPSNTLIVAQTVQLSAATKDAGGNVLTGRSISWSSSSTAVATVSSAGLVTAVAPGSATIFATSESKSGSATITVTAIPVNAVTVTPPTSTLVVGGTVQLTAATTDAGGHPLTGRTITWVSTTPSVATTSSAGLVTAVAVGTTDITATSEGKADTTQITVQACGTGLTLALGEVHTLTVSEKASLCLSNGTSAAEYAVVAFNNSATASTTTPVHLVATNTSAVLAPLSSRQAPMGGGLAGARTDALRSDDIDFRTREHRDLAGVFSRMRGARTMQSASPPSYLIGVDPTPVVGAIVQINANLSGNTCTDAKILHPAKVIAVLTHTIVLSDTLSPAGGYTPTEMAAFGAAFDTLGYALDTLNFGAPTDIDGNGRVAILFTPGVNVIPAPPGAFVGGLQASRDLAPLSTCAASNLGEMFYMPVPDPGQTINGNYATKSVIANVVLSTLVHEFQHLINAGRRVYVNNASSFEEVWLNEGLSHIAEELLYYRVSGNATKSNIGLTLVQSSQPQVDAFNTYQIQNIGRLKSYMIAPETNSPYSQVDGLAMRGAIWQLLRYSADLRGGTERSNWYPLVNATTTGQTNFNAVFGSITTAAHDWSIAQIADDAGLGVAAAYTNPSWNYRSMVAAINSGAFPLLTRSLTSTALDVSLNGGGSSYVRFRVAGSTVATLKATSSGVALPSSVDLTLVRTQ